MHLQDIQLASEGADKNVDKSHDTTTTETTTTEIYNTTVTPIVLDRNCEQKISDRTVDAKFWTNTVTTTHRDTCTDAKTTDVSTYPSVFLGIMLLVLGAIVLAVAYRKIKGHKKQRWEH